MAYTKYSLTPANNNATPPDGAPEGMLPSAVNDTMRDMMAQIRDVGDGIRNGTYTMTAPVITGGSITGASGSFTTLTATGNTSLDGGSFVFNESGADKDFRIEGDTDANLLFSDASTDRIGIGTSSPAQKLDVNGTANFGNINTGNGISTGSATLELGGLRTGDGTSLIDFHSVSGTDYETRLIRTGGVDGNFTIQNTGVGAFTIRQIGAGNLIFDTNNTERMRISSTGNVGIGTNNPTFKLDVYGGATSIRTDGATNSQITYSVAGAETAIAYVDSTQHILGSSTSIPVIFRTGGTEKMRLSSAGNLGIGTNSPNSRLEVNQLITFTSIDDFAQLVVKSASGANGKLLNIGVDDTNNISFIQSVNRGTSANSLVLQRYDGNVGVGIANPTSNLHVKNSIAIENSGGYGTLEMGGASGAFIDMKTPFSDDYDFRLQLTSTAAIIATLPAIPIQFITNDSERMRIDSSGSVLIGKTSNAGKPLEIYAASDAALRIQNSTTGTTNSDGLLLEMSGSNINLFNYEAGNIQFGTSGTERMRFNSSGELAYLCTGLDGDRPNAVGTYKQTNGNTKVRVVSDGTAAFQFYSPTGGGSPVGSITPNASSTTYATSSDYRLKENIAPMIGALAKVSQLKPCTYTWKADGSAGEGFIAHELQEVCPDAVIGEKDAVNEDGSIKPQGIDTSFLVATLTAAIQEQQAMIEELKQEVAALKAK